MPEAVIVSALRTPIGRAGKGSLVNERPDDMLAFVMREVVDRAGIDPAEIDDVVVGCAMTYGEADAINIARGAPLLAGFPVTVPGTQVNRFCASSLQALRMAFHAIKAGEGDTYLCGGVESVSRTAAAATVDGSHPKFLAPDAASQLYMSMGMTAETVAERYGVTRDDMDRFAQRSQEAAVAAQRSGASAREIAPYPTAAGVVDADDGPRPTSTLEKLQQLPPAFKPDGRVTAGNSCPLNDGAAAVLVMSDGKARAMGLRPLARIVATAVTGLEPEIMGVGPIEAVRGVLKRAGMSIDDVDVLELNEAFASQVLAVCRELGVDPFSPQLNPHGGAIALGHPFGMTGVRMMTTLLNDLRAFDGTIGVETMCVGGGQGMAMLIERLS
jgi:acetyl-CoA C-acetyltransferase